MILNSLLKTPLKKPENIINLEPPSQLNPKQGSTGARYIDQSHTGAINEMYVATEAMRRGARVFRNLSPSGNTDLVFEKDDQLIRVDVKHMKLDSRFDTYQTNHAKRQPKNVYFCFVHPETLEIRWLKFKGPQGIWKNFWNETIN